VVDGIPSFVLPDLATAHERDEWLRKQSEMQARDAQASMYDHLPGLRLLSPVEAYLTSRALRSRSKQVTLLAEIGCGTGRILQHLARLADYVIGVDFSLHSLHQCLRRMHSAGFLQKTLLIHADACFLPLADEGLDAAASCQLIEHLPSDRLRRRAVAEMQRVLKPGGRYAISGYHWSLIARLGGSKEGMHAGGIYFYRFTRDEFRQLVGAHLPVQSLRSIFGYIWLASGSKGGAND